MKMTEPFYEVRQISDLRDLTRQSVSLFGENVAFEVREKDGSVGKITYNEYYSQINSLGTALCDMGLRGKRIAVAGQNCYAWVLSYLATVCGTGVIVPIDKDLLFDDINNIFNVAEVELIFCDKAFMKKLVACKDALDPELRIVCFGQDEDSDDALSFDGLLHRGAELVKNGDTRFIDAKIDPEEMCSLLFTSGTTGVSKAVMLCHRNFCSDIMHTMQVVKIDTRDKGLSVLPLHHTYESTVMIFMGTYSGVTIAFNDGLKYVTKNFQEYHPSVFVSVPLMLEKVHKAIMKRIEKKKNGIKLFNLGKKAVSIGDKLGINLRSLFFKEIQEVFGGKMRLILVGAAAMNPRIIEDFHSFGIQIIYGYGLTECSPLVICNNDRLTLSESIGVPLPGVEVKIINKEPETGIGELCIKGDMVMMGYYNDSLGTARVLDKDGFFHTGDLGRVDSKGHYYITGRTKNVIVTKNGKNIYPEEVEYHLVQNRFVEECLVVEGKDDNGEAVVEADIYPNFDEICGVLGKQDVTDTEVLSFVNAAIEETNKKLPSYKRVSKVKIRETEFVKTTTAKIQRFKNVSNQ